MPDVHMQSPMKRPFLLLVVASIALAAVGTLLCAWVLVRPVDKGAFQDITQGWQARQGVEQGNLTGLQMQRQLTGEMRGAVLLVESNHQWVRVQLDDEVLYSTRGNNPRQNPGLAVHTVPLPEDYTDRELTLTLISPYPLYAQRVNRVYLGTPLGLNRQWLKVDYFPLMMAMFSTAIGGVVTAASCVLAAKNRVPGAVPGGVFLGIYALFWGLYTAADTLSFLLLVSPMAASGGILVLYTLWPFFLVGYLYCRFHYVKGLLVPALVLEGASAIACLAYAIFGAWEITPMLWGINLAHVITIIIVLVVGALEYRRGNPFLHYLLPWLLVAVGASLVAFLRFYVSHDYALDWLYQLSFFTLLAAMCGYNLYQTYRQWLADRDETRMLKQKDWAIAESYEAVQQKGEELRKLRHELTHQLAGVQALLTQGDADKARDFLGDFLQKARQDDAFTQNTFVDVILRDIHSRALAQNTAIAIEANLPPALPVPENDFCGILMNLADNALEACARIPDTARRTIRLRIHIRDPYLLIYCENARLPGPLRVRDGHFQTSKTGVGHGYGLRVVEDLVQRNEGLLDIDYAGARFVVSAALRLR